MHQCHHTNVSRLTGWLSRLWSSLHNCNGVKVSITWISEEHYASHLLRHFGAFCHWQSRIKRNKTSSFLDRKQSSCYRGQHGCAHVTFTLSKLRDCNCVLQTVDKFIWNVNRDQLIPNNIQGNFREMAGASLLLHVCPTSINHLFHLHIFSQLI
jgi:hypothetical protein